MTNYEKIKQMTVDEMADSDMAFFACPYGPPLAYSESDDMCKKFNDNCTDCTKHWLEREVEE